jgi:hypothetical protein
MRINKETGVSDRNAALLSGHGGKQRRRKWYTRRGIGQERGKRQEMKEGRREIKEERRGGSR